MLYAGIVIDILLIALTILKNIIVYVVRWLVGEFELLIAGLFNFKVEMTVEALDLLIMEGIDVSTLIGPELAERRRVLASSVSTGDLWIINAVHLVWAKSSRATFHERLLKCESLSRLTEKPAFLYALELIEPSTNLFSQYRCFKWILRGSGDKFTVLSRQQRKMLDIINTPRAATTSSMNALLADDGPELCLFINIMLSTKNDQVIRKLRKHLRESGTKSRLAEL